MFSLLRTSFANSRDNLIFSAVFIEAFLNEAVHSPLPDDCLAYIKGFLKLSHDATNNTRNYLDRFGVCRASRQINNNIDDDSPIEHSLTNGSKYISQFSAELDKSCDQNLKVIRILENMHNRLLTDNPTSPIRATHNLSTRSIPYQLSDGMCSVLNEMMLERDEAQSRLAFAEVLHKNERDELHIRVNDLTSQLEKTKSNPDLQSSIKHDEKAVIATNARQQIHENKALLDSDLELQSLCQQLAGEISARTAAETSIVRMKECRQLEQKQEAVYRQALENEVVKLRELVQQMSVREVEIVQESRMWRESFDAAVQSKADNVDI